MRVGAIALALLLPGSAAAEDKLEASGFVGFGWFSDETELGNSWAPEQVPNTAPVLGGRVGWRAAELPANLRLVVEAELSIATAFTGGSQFVGGSGRMSYFAPVFGWRIHAMARLSRWSLVRPHLAVGIGGATIASSSPFMSKETDPVVYWGPGLTMPVSPRWQVRVDLRHGIMAARDDGMTSTFELQLGVGATFGTPVKRTEPAPIPDEPVVTVDETDTDDDGLPDGIDKCPTEREIVNGVDDGDGCPEVDPDGDGIIGAADQCPDIGEDFDRHLDEDGCPDPDNDHDGIEDVRDGCPNEAETKNGVDDTDGCADVIPADVTKALAVKLEFEPNRARMTNAAKKAVEPLLAMLGARADVKITVTGRPVKANGGDLAKRRAEAVKWHLVDQGIAEDRVETAVGDFVKPAPRAAPGPAIELTLLTPQ